MVKRLLRHILPNPLDRLLERAASQGRFRFLLAWNRGLGDIPLGLFAIVERIRQYIPHADITFITRADLYEGFQMLLGVEVLVVKEWKRKQPSSIEEGVKSLGRSLKEWDIIIESPDPTYWVRWQLGKLTPKLRWDPSWDALCNDFSLDPERKYLGVHIQTETSYGYEKNWPLEYFQALFAMMEKKTNKKILLFGFSNVPALSLSNTIDLRGRTSIIQMLSIIKNRCTHLLVPDSGVLSLTYFMNESFPLRIVSLWSDPRQGVLKQNVAPPNPLLTHVPLIAPEGDLRVISPEKAYEALGI